MQRSIDRRWIEQTLTAPDREAADRHDPALRHAFRRIPEGGGHVLRVVYNAETRPIRMVTVHLDRKAGRNP